MSPRATLRLQLHQGFTFADAAARVPYVAALGISHLYLSPILTARAGSMHGYDVVDPGAVNPELGGEDGLRALVAEARMHGLGVIVDIVPNHMAVGHADNRAWLDVLEWGPLSRHADFFDIDWDVADPALHHRLLAPFLGKPYGEALAAGELVLGFDPAIGRFHVDYHEHRFPLAPQSIAGLLGTADGALRGFAGRFQRAARVSRGRRGDAFEQVCSELRDAVRDEPTLQQDMARLLPGFDGRERAGRQALHRLLEQQHYRLAWWRTAPDEINWRRFFDIIDLAGVRVQEPAAFELQHATIFRLYADGLVDGLRIDHIDGLADPRAYCRRLRQRLNRLVHQRPPALREPPWIVVEKILAAREDLPLDWQVDGSTGYAFMSEVGALLHDAAGEAPLTALWTDVAGPAGDIDHQQREARRRIPQQLLASDFNACARALHAIARSDPVTRDWTLAAIRRVLAEILVQLPVYRTYADARGRSRSDAAIMKQTITAAMPACAAAERPLLLLVDRWLGGEAPRSLRSTRERRARLQAIGRFQQLSAPVAAKAIEDTLFYRHGRLLSRNEVGAHPAEFALDAGAFHRECLRRAERYPRSMLATATHDHKRGEDVRARLAVLSELPDAWADAVARWRSDNADTDRAGPDAIDEYMLYQTLLGAWPPTLRPDDADGLAGFAERVATWQLKALREAKRHSSWAEPDEGYEHACRAFVERLLDPARSAGFIASLHARVERMAPTGAINGLAQTLLKTTCPGVPDVYQGCELWDFSLVDPDNRRPVDFDAREAALRSNDGIDVLLDRWRDGRIKQRLLQRALALRAALPGVFAAGGYRPLRLAGPRSAHAFGFVRHDDEDAVIVVVARHAARLVEADRPVIAAERWQDTMLRLPKFLRERQWRSALEPGRAFTPASSGLPLADLFATLPVQALRAEHAGP